MSVTLTVITQIRRCKKHQSPKTIHAGPLKNVVLRNYLNEGITCLIAAMISPVRHHGHHFPEFDVSLNRQLQYPVPPEFRISVPRINISIKFHGSYAYTNAFRSGFCNFDSQRFRI